MGDGRKAAADGWQTPVGGSEAEFPPSLGQWQRQSGARLLASDLWSS